MSCTEETVPGGGEVRLGPWRLDLTSGLVAGSRGTKHLHPKAAAVLTLFIENPGVVLTHREILDQVWPRLAITANVVPRAVSEIRSALEDDYRSPQFIETVPREGYRLLLAPDRSPQRRGRPRYTIPLLVLLSAFIATAFVANHTARRLMPGEEPDGARSAVNVDVEATYPEEIRVSHTPTTVLADRYGHSGYRYSWQMLIRLETEEPVRVEGFGVFSLEDDSWHLSTFTGNAFGARHFIDWSDCPDAVIRPERGCTHLAWYGEDELKDVTIRWYYIGTTAHQRKVQGLATILLKGRLANQEADAGDM